ncbi:hypothetical protein BDN67DRAFT_970975, partial [Paxillus ammoniavirescens]
HPILLIPFPQTRAPQSHPASATLKFAFHFLMEGDNGPQELCETKLCVKHLCGQNSREWNQRMSVGFQKVWNQLMFVHPPAFLQASLCHRGPSSTARFFASFRSYIS